MLQILLTSTALTFSLSKLYTNIIKHCWHNFMVTNNYLDLDVQKAFANNVPGWIEHEQKLLSIIVNMTAGSVWNIERIYRSVALRGTYDVCWGWVICDKYYQIPTWKNTSGEMWFSNEQNFWHVKQ